mmetsp:Transcript_87630/g.248171  ORF Transcript_87630/g.248171 Transcript_87630/m.248171 type:complete len:897 (-) Transcript_87630:687-3377(-)
MDFLLNQCKASRRRRSRGVHGHGVPGVPVEICTVQDHVAQLQALPLPVELWVRIVLCLQPRDYARLCRCSARLVPPIERLRLWRIMCHVEGYARFAPFGTDTMIAVREDEAMATLRDLGNEADAAGGTLWEGASVNWRRCFQVNATADAGGQGRGACLFARVRVRGEELRVPAPRAYASGQSSQLRRLLERGWRPKRTLTEALLGILEPSSAPFRFRELGDGRPGLLLQNVLFSLGDGPAQVLVEWPVGRSFYHSWCWQIPPSPTSSTQSGGPHLEDSADDEPWVEGPFPWGLRYGWVVELQPTEEQQGPGASRFLHVGAGKPAGKITLDDLCQELQKQLPSLGMWDPRRSCTVLPASLQRPFGPLDSVQGGMRLRADLRWTQGERLSFAELPASASEQLLCARATQRGAHGGVTLFSRSAERPWVPPSTKRRRLRDTAQGGSSPAAAPQFCPPSSGSSSGPSGVSLAPDGSKWPEPGTGCEAAASPAGDAEPEEALHHTATLFRRRRVTEAPVGQHVPHARKLLLSSKGARQFEFHPTRPGTLLIGRKDGLVTVLDGSTDTWTHSTEVDTFPILGLSWLRTSPQWAVCGASQSGTTCVLRYDESKPGFLETRNLEPFPKLSSLSVNCTDDFLMTSGFSVDMALYDLVTGKRINMFRGLHQNFINIVRFAHRSPHVFATCSFDHTCKVWDLRGPIVANKPARSFGTPTLNVMCSFSPDDRHLLCSGVDSALMQFPVDTSMGDTKAEAVGSRLPVPAQNRDMNYRRSLYLADGAVVATAATNESLLRFYSREAPHRHLGLIDFRHSLRGHVASAAPRPENIVERTTAAAGRATGTRQRQQATATAPAHSANEPAEDAQGNDQEFLQSLRCHPTDSQLLGVLLSKSADSLISLVHLDS